MNFPVRPLSSNFTTPSNSANSVSSLPRPTFLPGLPFRSPLAGKYIAAQNAFAAKLLQTQSLRIGIAAVAR